MWSECGNAKKIGTWSCYSNFSRQAHAMHASVRGHRCVVPYRAQISNKDKSQILEPPIGCRVMRAFTALDIRQLQPTFASGCRISYAHACIVHVRAANEPTLNLRMVSSSPNHAQGQLKMHTATACTTQTCIVPVAVLNARHARATNTLQRAHDTIPVSGSQV